jgi:hypothetical protein
VNPVKNIQKPPASWLRGFPVIRGSINNTLIRYEYGFGFGGLYHPYTEVLASGTVFAGARLLAAFYDGMELWRGNLNDWQALPVQAWRFGKSVRTERLEKRVPSVHFGWLPGEMSTQAKERAEHLFRLRESIDRQGYVCDSQQPIDGVWVGKTFLVLGGQHRVAVLISLGWERIPVRTIGRKNTPKRLVAKRLPLVRAGHLALEDATAVLNRVESGFTPPMARLAGFPFAGRPMGAGTDASL